MSYATTYISVSETAWKNLLNITDHPHRSRPYQQFTGYNYVTMPARPPSGKGLSEFLASFLFKPVNTTDTHNYSTTIPYPILPDSFTDEREWQTMDYQSWGYPGDKPDYTYAQLSVMRSRSAQAYTIWSDGSDTERHGLVLPYLEPILECVHYIVQYWHISTPKASLPRSLHEEFSAFVNAIGMQYLSHPLLKPAQTTASISDNTFYRNVDSIMAKAIEQREKRIEEYRLAESAPPSHTQPFRRVKCQEVFEDALIGEVRCKNTAEWTIIFGEYGVMENHYCTDCMRIHTNPLPASDYKKWPYTPPLAKAPIPPRQLPTKKIKFKIIPKRPEPTITPQEPKEPTLPVEAIPSIPTLFTDPVPMPAKPKRTKPEIKYSDKGLPPPIDLEKYMEGMFDKDPDAEE